MIILMQLSIVTNLLLFISVRSQIPKLLSNDYFVLKSSSFLLDRHNNLLSSQYNPLYAYMYSIDSITPSTAPSITNKPEYFKLIMGPISPPPSSTSEPLYPFGRKFNNLELETLPDENELMYCNKMIPVFNSEHPNKIVFFAYDCMKENRSFYYTFMFPLLNIRYFTTSWFEDSGVKHLTDSSREYVCSQFMNSFLDVSSLIAFCSIRMDSSNTGTHRLIFIPKTQQLVPDFKTPALNSLFFNLFKDWDYPILKDQLTNSHQTSLFITCRAIAGGIKAIRVYKDSTGNFKYTHLFYTTTLYDEYKIIAVSIFNTLFEVTLISTNVNVNKSPLIINFDISKIADAQEQFALTMVGEPKQPIDYSLDSLIEFQIHPVASTISPDQTPHFAHFSKNVLRIFKKSSDDQLKVIIQDNLNAFKEGEFVLEAAHIHTSNQQRLLIFAEVNAPYKKAILYSDRFYFDFRYQRDIQADMIGIYWPENQENPIIYLYNKKSDGSVSKLVLLLCLETALQFYIPKPSEKFIPTDRYSITISYANKHFENFDHKVKSTIDVNIQNDPLENPSFQDSFEQPLKIYNDDEQLVPMYKDIIRGNNISCNKEFDPNEPDDPTTVSFSNALQIELYFKDEIDKKDQNIDLRGGIQYFERFDNELLIVGNSNGAFITFPENHREKKVRLSKLSKSLIYKLPPSYTQLKVIHVQYIDNQFIAILGFVNNKENLRIMYIAIYDLEDFDKDPVYRSTDIDIYAISEAAGLVHYLSENVFLVVGVYGGNGKDVGYSGLVSHWINYDSSKKVFSHLSTKIQYLDSFGKLTKDEDIKKYTCITKIKSGEQSEKIFYLISDLIKCHGKWGEASSLQEEYKYPRILSITINPKKVNNPLLSLKDLYITNEYRLQDYKLMDISNEADRVYICPKYNWIFIIDFRSNSIWAIPKYSEPDKEYTSYYSYPFKSLIAEVK